LEITSLARSTRVDLIRFEVIRNALVAATEEMALALKRSAYSTNVKTRSDFSCAFFDHSLRPIAQGFTQPVHLGSLVRIVPAAISKYDPDRLVAGDTIITNHPFEGGVHLNDVTLISPVYVDSELLGYVASLAHHVDVGGGAPASIGAFREVFQEGVIIPPVRLTTGGEIIPDIFNLILAQIRSKHETGGDFRAQLAANNTGIRRLQELVRQHGLEAVREDIDELVHYTERRTRSEVNKLPRGVFSATGQVDTDGYTDEPVTLSVRIVIDDEGVLFDFTDSDRQRRSPVNSTYAQTYSACSYILKALLDPDIPVNAGFYKFVQLEAPLGSVTNCTPPFPVVGGWETHMRLVEVALLALAPAMPDRVPAGTKGMICHSGFGGIDPDTGEYYCFLETLAGGYGARSRKDGPDAVQVHGQNTENAPVEETELNYPVRIVRYELIADSEGAGEFRGGLGLRRDYMFPDRPTTFTVLADRDKQGPHGLRGGLPGKVAEYILNPDSGRGTALRAKGTVELQPGDVVSFRTCGGGGYGHPFSREPARVLRDVREGKVGLERARRVYGVVIDPREWVVDLVATDLVRSGAGDE